MSLHFVNKLYYHHFFLPEENKCKIYKYTSLEQLANMLNKEFDPKFTVKELEKFETNHFTVFNGRMWFGKNRYELETLINDLIGDRQCDDFEECEDYY
jgi:hypothetical protein